jgi:hypothetical protein
MHFLVSESLVDPIQSLDFLLVALLLLRQFSF